MATTQGMKAEPAGQQAGVKLPNEAEPAGTLQEYIAKPAYGQEGEDGQTPKRKVASTSDR
jgi:hypothetical protein